MFIFCCCDKMLWEQWPWELKKKVWFDLLFWRDESIIVGGMAAGTGSWDPTSSLQARDREGSRMLPVMYFLQQGWTSWTSLNSTTNWGPSVQMPRPWGAFPIQSATWWHLFYHVTEKSGGRGGAVGMCKVEKSITLRPLQFWIRKAYTGHVLPIWQPCTPCSCWAPQPRPMQWTHWVLHFTWTLFELSRHCDS